MNNDERTKRYFEMHGASLQEIKQTSQSALARIVAEALLGNVHGTVLDIGSGVNIDYSLKDVARLFCLDVLMTALSDRSDVKQVSRVQGDARTLPFESEYFDTVLSLHVVHHLAGNTVAATQADVEASLSEAFRVLKRKSRYILVDAFCPGFVQGMQTVFFQSVSCGLRILRRPMIYYFSLEDMRKMFLRVGFKDVETTVLDTGNVMCHPFTSKIGIPFKYMPLTHMMIVGEK